MIKMTFLLSMLLLTTMMIATSCAAFSTTSHSISNGMLMHKKKTPFQIPSRVSSPSCIQPLFMAVSTMPPPPPTTTTSSTESSAEQETPQSNHQQQQQPPPSTSPYDWSFVDAVYLITCPNADPDSKRLTKATQILKDVGLFEKTTIKKFETDDEDRIRGCYTSHLSVMRDAISDLEQRRAMVMGRKKKNGGGGGGEMGGEWWTQLFPFLNNDDGGKEKEHDVNVHAAATEVVEQQKETNTNGNARILVIEDNIEVTGNLRQSVLDAINTFTSSSSQRTERQNSSPWDMILLSYIPYVPNLTVSKTPSTQNSIVQLSCGIGSALGTTAYIINESSIQTLIKQDDTKGYYAPIPDLMAELFPNSRYAAYPTPFLRAPKTASLVNPQLDDLRSLLFQPPLISFSQSLLAGSGLSTNVLLPLVVSALLIVAGLAGKTSLDAAVELVTTGRYEGNVLIPVVSSMFSLFSLAVLAQGALLAPKPPPTEEQQSDVVTVVE